MPLTLGQRLQQRAEALAAKARHSDAARAAQPPEPEALTSRRPATVAEAIGVFKGVFPNARIVEDYQQIGHDDWVDRLTGNVTHDPPRGTVPLISG